MPQIGTIYRVLVASPSDCEDERQVVTQVIHAWNAANSLPLGAILEPVLWETHARPELGGRPQAILNTQLVENCDILIGTFWTRLGTKTGKAESGTAEEIKEFRRQGKHVLLYFSSRPVALDSVDAGQYAALKVYKDKLRTDGIVFDYESPAQLRELLQGHLASLMHNLIGKQTIEQAEDSPTSELGKYRAEFESFLRQFEAAWVVERDSDPHNTEVGKEILGAALDEILSFRSKATTGFEDVNAVLDDAAKQCRVLQRFMVYMDGGKSFSQFWQDGNAVLEKLKKVPSLIMRLESNGAK
jgi:hypothetical protein